MALARASMPAHRLAAHDSAPAEALEWLEDRFAEEERVMIYSSAPPEERSPGRRRSWNERWPPSRSARPSWARAASSWPAARPPARW
ncbi:hypothetical protein ACFQQB_62195 [Nonomuraea rubra]|uniref:hypothetical protein n=1 Tax=Nonomuraea rubra TaxID=46180 RepID=UPI003614B96C